MLYEKVEKIIDSEIRPKLSLHGGNVEIISIEDKDLRIRLTGNCKGCPSAQITTEDIIKTTLKDHLGDEINDVILVNDIGDDLLDFARKILSSKN
ncbi:NifU family protein [Anaerosalibacter bizertensis]|uniref:NifU family protein n=1 Tax=Anaerosalibacter bizertensis TaxID=932217 RepID=UPI001C0EFD06|nr:NifU family protein [Anaerosalibacter bizertensis]MBU5292975.1 NifU family protein [Anaerosalibacter bizertensis]